MTNKLLMTLQIATVIAAVYVGAYVKQLEDNIALQQDVFCEALLAERDRAEISLLRDPDARGREVGKINAQMSRLDCPEAFSHIQPLPIRPD